MNSRQKLITKVITSIAIGIIGFCLTMPIVILSGGLLFGPPEGHAFFSPRDAGLFLTSILVGLAVAVFVGIKYHLHLGS
ncbi:MAG TPA: hypothetical protein VFS61_05670 [Anaerolineales bacterium]|nr:hypothetical protein [Anaerolineales bacterium]